MIYSRPQDVLAFDLEMSVAVDFWRVLLAFFCSPICDSTLTQSLLIVKGCCLLSLLTPSEYGLQIRPSLIKFTVQT